MRSGRAGPAYPPATRARWPITQSPHSSSRSSTWRHSLWPPVQETPKCVAFEFNDHVGGGTCFLKDSTGVVPRVLEGAQSGVLIQPGTAISAEAVRANHAATTKIPAAAAVAAGAGTPAGAAATEAAGPWEASSAGTALGQSAGPNKVLQLGASLTAASGGTPGSRVDIGEVRGSQLQQCTWQGC